MNKFQIMRLLALYASPEMMETIHQLDSELEAARSKLREANCRVADFVKYAEDRHHEKTTAYDWDKRQAQWDKRHDAMATLIEKPFRSDKDATFEKSLTPPTPPAA